ncbi:unnamed protein product, partial [Rotaria sp. Silwood1]
LMPQQQQQQRLVVQPPLEQRLMAQ